MEKRTAGGAPQHLYSPPLEIGRKKTKRRYSWQKSITFAPSTDNVHSMLPGIFIILLFYAAGEFIGTLTGGLIPGSVIGMILLFAALCGKVVKPETVRPVARFLTDNMGLFFLPAGVGIVNAMDILSQSWQAVLTACAVSTVAVIVTVACTQEWLESRSRRRAAKTRTVSHPLPAAGVPDTDTAAQEAAINDTRP